MTASHNLRHRRAAAAAKRRSPAPLPQLGFDPFPAGNGGDHGTPTSPDDGGFGGFGGFTFPPVGSHDSTSSQSSSTSSSSSSSSTVSSSSTSTSSSVSSTSTSTTSSQATPTLKPTTSAATSSSSTALRITTMPTQTALVTLSAPLTASSSVTAAAASSTATTSSGLNTGAVVGGIAAGIVAIAAIAFALTYFLRRARKREDAADFDAHDFRRSAMLIDDPPTHSDTVARGFNPRPPTMIERRLASPAPTFGAQYGHPGPAYNHENEYAAGPANHQTDYGTSFQSYAPGQIVNTNNAVLSPISANSAHPMLSPQSPYGQSPFSPVPQQYPVQGQPEHEPAPYPVPFPVLTRQGSSHSQEEHPQPGSPNALTRESAPASDYVDLSRSSVSPFQAAQYVEISRRLHTNVPEGLHTADIERELPPLPPKEISPFVDPPSVPPSPGAQYAIDRRNLELNESRVSGESMASQTLEFPVPPSPAHSMTSSRYRVDSTPPTLPEIHVESRVSVGNYPGLRNSGAVGVSALGPGLTAGAVSRFPTTPSPLASSFGFPTPPANETSFPSPKFPPTAATDTFGKKRGSMHSVYNAEDAYGGI